MQGQLETWCWNLSNSNWWPQSLSYWFIYNGDNNNQGTLINFNMNIRVNPVPTNLYHDTIEINIVITHKNCVYCRYFAITSNLYNIKYYSKSMLTVFYNYISGSYLMLWCNLVSYRFKVINHSKYLRQT